MKHHLDHPCSDYRKRRCGLFAAGLIVLGLLLLAAGYASRLPLLYRAYGELQILKHRDDTKAIGVKEYVTVLTSDDVVRKVLGRLSEADRAAFLKPYGYASATEARMAEKLMRKNLVVTPNPDVQIIGVQYRHPDRQLAAQIDRMFLDEAVAYTNRRRIDETMVLVEALKKTADWQQDEVNRLSAAMATYREDHPTASTEDLTGIVKYQEWSRKLESAKKTLDGMIQKMRASTISAGPVEMDYRIRRSPVPADEDAGYLQPTGGILIVAGIAVLTVGILSSLFLKKERDQSEQSGSKRRFYQVGLAIFSYRVHRYEAALFGVVFVFLFAVSLERAFEQPRIYQSSVTLAVSDSAKDEGWDELSVSDFQSWLPFIRLEVESGMNYDKRLRSALLSPYGGMTDGEQSVIERILRRDCSAVYHADSRTVDVLYRHPDFQVTGEVVGWFGQAYERYPLTELNARLADRRKSDRQYLRLDLLKMEIVQKERRMEALKGIMASYRDSHASTWGVSKYDESYGKRVREWNRTQVELASLYRQMRDFSSRSDFESSPVRIVKYSGWASTNDYLLMPIIRSLALGFLGAIGCGVLGVLVIRTLLALPAAMLKRNGPDNHLTKT